MRISVNQGSFFWGACNQDSNVLVSIFRIPLMGDRVWGSRFRGCSTWLNLSSPDPAVKYPCKASDKHCINHRSIPYAQLRFYIYVYRGLGHSFAYFWGPKKTLTSSPSSTIRLTSYDLGFRFTDVFARIRRTKNHRRGSATRLSYWHIGILAERLTGYGLGFTDFGLQRPPARPLF